MVPTLAAQEVSTLVRAGDTYPGLAGAIAEVLEADVSNNGWLVEARTDLNQQVLLDPTGVLGLEGDPLPAPPGAAIVNWDAVRLNNAGARSHNIYISGVESAVYWNNVFQLAHGDFGPTPTFSPNSPYVDFREAWVNDANQLLVQGSLNDPAIGTSTFDSFLLVRDLSPTGALLSETVVVKADDVLPGMTTPQKVDYVQANGDNQIGFNNNGDVIFGVKIRGVLFPNTDDAYYVNGTTLVAREGAVEPLTGRIWKTLEGAVDINDSGVFAYRGRLDAAGSGDWVVIKNNVQVLGMEGGTIPAIAPHVFREFTTFVPQLGPVRIDNTGNVVWYGEWEDAGGVLQGRALFLNDEILVQSPVLTVEGFSVNITGDEFDISDDGRFVVFRGITTGGSEGAFRIDLAGFEDYCNGDGGSAPGCTPCPCGNSGSSGTIGGCTNSHSTNARLIPFGIPKVSADSLRFEVVGANATTFGILLSGNDRLPNNPANPCFGLDSGVTSFFLDGLRCIGGGTIRHGARPSDANGAIGVTTNGWGPPNGPAGGLIAQGGFSAGQTRHFQCFYRENPASGCLTGQNTTQGVSTQILP